MWARDDCSLLVNVPSWKEVSQGMQWSPPTHTESERQLYLCHLVVSQARNVYQAVHRQGPASDVA